MNNYLQTDMPGLNGLLEKHKQMQERSAIKTQTQVLQTTTNVASPANPMLQPPNGLYHLGNPAMVPYPNSYFMGNPIMHSASSYYNPNSMLPPPSNYFNPMLQQPPNNYFNPNPMIQTAPNNFFPQNLMIPTQTNFLNFNPVPQFPVPQNYFNQNFFTQYNNNFLNQNHISQFQSDPYIQSTIAQTAANTSSAQNFVLQCINGDFNRNPMSQCIDNNYNQNPVSSSVNSNFNMLQNVNNNFNQNYVNSQKSSGYDPSHQGPQKNISTLSKNKVYWNPNFKKTSSSIDSKTVSNTPIQSQEQISNKTVQDNQISVPGKQKIHVNPNFIPKLASVSSATSSSNDIPNENYNVDKNIMKANSPEKLQENDNIIEPEMNKEKSDASKENENSSIIILTKRKLIRVKKDSKSDIPSINLMKPLVTPRRRLLSKKLKISPKKISPNRLYNTGKLKYIKSTVKKALGRSLGLISIDGVLYNKSRNRLIRSDSSVVKQKHDSVSDKNVEYYVAEDGKKLLKLDIVKKKSDISLAKLNTTISPVKSYKANVSNKVKQRSLQILRDKMRKNNQPCLLFKKFGYCANQLKGTCPKIHDKKLVAVCRKFLQGKCLLNDCPLSHDVGPEKMPTCKYFLEGFCTREGCPYLHVKVSSKKPICQEFLRGYCPRGNECPNRHIIACPEFDKAGSCSKGKFCPYPHKSPLTESKKSKGSVRRKSEASASSRVLKRKSLQLDKQSEVESLEENKKRYYDESSEDLSLKRLRLLKQVDIVKDVHSSTSEPPPRSEEVITEVERDDSSKDDQKSEETPELVSNKPRRPPIGPLPAYIPIE